MSEIPRETVLRAVLPILSEAFAGPADPRGAHFANGDYPLGALRQIARWARVRAEATAA